MPKRFYIKSTVAHDSYFLGEFSRDVPPSPYFGALEDACWWESRKGAEDSLGDTGGEVVEIEEGVIKGTTEYRATCDALEYSNGDVIVTLRIKDGAALAKGWSCSDSFSLNHEE